MINISSQKSILIVFTFFLSFENNSLIAQQDDCNCDSIITASKFNFSIDSFYQNYFPDKPTVIDIETKESVENLIKKLNDSTYTGRSLKDIIQLLKVEFGEIKCDLTYSIDFEEFCFVFSLDLEEHYARVRIQTKEEPETQKKLLEMLCFAHLVDNVERIKEIPTDCIPEVHIRAIITRKLILKK